MVLVARERCLICDGRLAAPIEPSATPCPFCRSRFRLLNTHQPPSLVVNPPTDFYTVETVRRISESLPSVLGEGASLIFDFSKSPFLSSSAIGELLILRRRLSASAIQIKLVVDTAKPGVQHFLDRTHLDRMFPVFGSVEQADPSHGTRPC
jgi:anti-anti-sigma regulatory factor